MLAVLQVLGLTILPPMSALSATKKFVITLAFVRQLFRTWLMLMQMRLLSLERWFGLGKNRILKKLLIMGSTCNCWG